MALREERRISSEAGRMGWGPETSLYQSAAPTLRMQAFWATARLTAASEELKKACEICNVKYVDLLHKSELLS